MEQWEYLTEILNANVENQGVKEFLQRHFPNWRTLPKHTVVATMPRLNTLGDLGWELVHMEPVFQEEDGRIFFAGNLDAKSSSYFGVFKRRKSQ